MTGRKIILKTALAVGFVLSLIKGSLAYERAGGVSVGAYGSSRLEISSQTTTFTLRRIVPTFTATIAGRLKFYTEIEFERFGFIELEEEMAREGGGLLTKTEIEGLSGTEVKLEQFWGEIEFFRALRLRAGGVLPPVGRFNDLHDDDLWEPAKRPLAVREANTLPVPSAWTELGVGFKGDFDVGDMLAGYEAYVVQGVTLEHDLEVSVLGGQVREGKRLSEVEFESVVRLRAGSMSVDTKRAKAFTGRFFFSPALGHELAISGYIGRYTPDILPPATLYSLAFDFKTEIGFFEAEGEYIATWMTNIDRILSSLASLIYTSEVEEILDNSLILKSEIVVNGQNIADLRHGGWILFRFKFFPSFLRGSPFDIEGESKFIFFIRPEYVMYRNMVVGAEFEDGKLVKVQKDSPSVFRGAVGIAWRLVPTFLVSISYERTQLLSGQELVVERGKPTDAFLLNFAFGL